MKGCLSRRKGYEGRREQVEKLLIIGGSKTLRIRDEGSGRYDLGDRVQDSGDRKKLKERGSDAV